MLRAPFVYYSTDMSLVEVNFAAIAYDVEAGTYKTGHLNPVTEEFMEGAPTAKAVLPRAYISTFYPYTRKSTNHPDFQVETLPDRLFGRNLTITMTYPEGLPYSVVYGTWPQHKPDFSLPKMGVGVADWQEADKQMRAMEIKASIRALDTDIRAFDFVLKPDQFMQRVGEYEGLILHTSPPTSWQYYFDDGPDEIRRISCTASVEKSRPHFYCQYLVPINSRLYAELTFLDFRFHGGREFARERIRLFKKIMCPVFKCDEKALKATEIGKSEP